jgi:hypothetical protein
MMHAALREMMTGLIDYAGLFPPAKLPLDAALRNWHEYQAGPDAWMLGRFILPAARMPELTDVGGGMAVSALGRGGTDAASFAEGLKADVADIEACRARLGPRVTIDVLEVKPPAGVAVDLAPARAAGLRVFLEQPAGQEPSIRAGEGTGLKIRTGGLEPSAFPTPRALAWSLAWAARTGTPFKATAGLHHPFPIHDAHVGARMFGFINVFLAGLMLARGGLTEADAEEMLTAPATDFTQDDSHITWRGKWALDIDGIRAGRMLMTSFGSCSFDEPRDDLRALGWM